MGLQHDILQWREQQARVEGIESYKILSKACIDAIVYARPTTREELTSIKGIKDAKYKKYGQAIFALVKGEHAIQEAYSTEEGALVSEAPLSVSLFLDSLNRELSGMAARIQGEVTSISERPRVIYFTLKDAVDESTLDCLIWRNQYEISGVQLTVGDEVIVEGVPEIYKPTGRLSLKTMVVEVSGEGALKKAYDELYAKLEARGWFVPEQKQPLPLFAKKVGLITSLDGAAIGDFRMNLAQCGFVVEVYSASVEGKRAVFELLEAIRYFEQATSPVDVLVIIRGGGSLESLQAFNTEALAQAVHECSIPTLVGVGHEKDVTLVALAADSMESTPTACAKALSAPFQDAKQTCSHQALRLTSAFQTLLQEAKRNSEFSLRDLYSCLEKMKEGILGKERRFVETALSLQFALREQTLRLREQAKTLSDIWQRASIEVGQYMDTVSQRLDQYDPKQVLKLGYSLVTRTGRVVKETRGITQGDTIDIRFADGGLEATVTKIN